MHGSIKIQKRTSVEKGQEDECRRCKDECSGYKEGECWRYEDKIEERTEGYMKIKMKIEEKMIRKRKQSG